MRTLVLALATAWALAALGAGCTAGAPTPTPTPAVELDPSMVEMEVVNVFLDRSRGAPVVVLRTVGGDKYLPIWIGPPEAAAIAAELEHLTPARPLTHDLLDSVISNLGAKVRYVLISDLIDQTYYARVLLVPNGKAVEIDARPSDAIALALRADAPIYSYARVVREAGVDADDLLGPGFDLDQVTPEPEPF